MTEKYTVWSGDDHKVHVVADDHHEAASRAMAGEKGVAHLSARELTSCSPYLYRQLYVRRLVCWYVEDAGGNIEHFSTGAAMEAAYRGVERDGEEREAAAREGRPYPEKKAGQHGRDMRIVATRTPEATGGEWSGSVYDARDQSKCHGSAQAPTWFDLSQCLDDIISETDHAGK